MKKNICKGNPKPIIHKVLETVHGPIISDILDSDNKKLSLCSMSLKEGRNIMAWMKLNKSKNWNDFVDGVKEITAPGLNIVYADIEGNTGYYNSGKMPIRDKAVASVPSMGWTGSHDWNEFVPFSEMPHVLNPERGYIFKFEPQDFTDMQMDFMCIPGKIFGKLYKGLKFDTAELQQAADGLANWDGILSTDSLIGTYYKVTKYLMVKRIYMSALPEKLAEELLGKGFNPIYGPVNTFLGHNTRIA
ncbi:MAG: penicillin acylase family protein [Bacteroidetes bacterium]|nr:penicillin acylase family protein [Bacteroidota bacterium]